ncbi:hypothetical protein JCGZ_13946 [Jatropha curcas]|uniref:Uncharacterized protein n=1 Tax=Jatropha curcas TaxID=180498 RepID=A0A067K7E4_JATCU|nr:hypothetical protein JCGZ_13946 [Jatropha curcas]
MAERQSLDQQQPRQIDPPQLQSPSQQQQPAREDMLECVTALETALLPCLPARELQAIDRSPHPSHQSRLLSLAAVLDDTHSFRPHLLTKLVGASNN